MKKVIKLNGVKLKIVATQAEDRIDIVLNINNNEDVLTYTRCMCCGKYEPTKVIGKTYICNDCKQMLIAEMSSTEPVKKIVEKAKKGTRARTLGKYILNNPIKTSIVDYDRYNVKLIPKYYSEKLVELINNDYNTDNLISFVTGLKAKSVYNYVLELRKANIVGIKKTKSGDEYYIHKFVKLEGVND